MVRNQLAAEKNLEFRKSRGFPFAKPASHAPPYLRPTFRFWNGQLRPCSHTNLDEQPPNLPFCKNLDTVQVCHCNELGGVTSPPSTLIYLIKDKKKNNRQNKKNNKACWCVQFAQQCRDKICNLIFNRL